MKNYTIGKLARKVSRALRSNSTDAEKKLWSFIKNRQFLNLRFLRQHPIFYQFNNKKNFFIADFYCHEIKMVIELDGYIHDKQRDYDQVRTEILEFKNILIVRFENAEIMKNLDHSLAQLKLIITKRKNDLKKVKV
jgi:very-short-patch-repair endonuclease